MAKGSRHICGNPNTQLDYGDGDVSFLKVLFSLSSECWAGRAAFFLINWLPFPLLKTFEDVVDQKKYRFEDKEWWGLCARQVDQRQGSHYNAYMVRTFGGQNCLKHFSRWALHQPRNFSRVAEAGKPETVAGAA